ncbi:MAG: ABC transporter ATP-binding protein [Labilithrix sp.]|nr:ABC transporter ATP-binding protein [Labilithrix sp.]
MTRRGLSAETCDALSGWDLLSTWAPEIQDTSTQGVEESSRRRGPEGLGVRECLSLRAVTAGYEGAARPQLREVELRLGAGELVCVLGPNGAGKSTLVRVASGLLAPWKGSVHLLGGPIATLGRAAIARSLAVVEQMQDLAMGFSVREVVAMGRAPHQGTWMRASESDEAIVDDALERCDLEGLAHRPAHALSGGEQKRVAIARALAQGPKVLLLDEPGAFLDVRHQLDLYELLVKEVKERELGCLVVMHDLNVAAQFADRIVLMKDGRVVASGAVEEVMTWQTLKETFDADLYCGLNDLTGARFFLPMRGGAHPTKAPVSPDDPDPTRS